MNLSIGGYLKLGSSGGVEVVFIVIPPAPIDPDIPMEDIPNAMVDEYGRFLLDSFWEKHYSTRTLKGKLWQQNL